MWSPCLFFIVLQGEPWLGINHLLEPCCPASSFPKPARFADTGTLTKGLCWKSPSLPLPIGSSLRYATVLLFYCLLYSTEFMIVFKTMSQIFLAIISIQLQSKCIRKGILVLVVYAWPSKDRGGFTSVLVAECRSSADSCGEGRWPGVPPAWHRPRFQGSAQSADGPDSPKFDLYNLLSRSAWMEHQVLFSLKIAKNRMKSSDWFITCEIPGILICLHNALNTWASSQIVLG